MKNYTKYIILFFLGGIFTVSLITSEAFKDIFILPKQFYFIFSTLITTISIFVILLIIRNTRTLAFNIIDVFFILYTGYTFINYFASGPSTIDQEIIILFLLGIIYFVIKFFLKEFKHLQFFILIFIILGLIQAFIGIIQFANAVKSQGFDFWIIGTLGNPGPFTNYLVSVLPLSLGVILFIRKETTFDKILKIISIIAFIAIMSILFVCKARTAWIASFIGIVLLVNDKYSILQRINQKLQSTLLKISLTSIILIISITAGYKLYSLKKDSSLGRLFIWETTMDIIKENPLFGTGYKTFSVEHNKKQAEYFINNPNDNKRGYLADNVTNAFNDYLEISAELGLVGLLLFLALIFTALFSKEQVAGENIHLHCMFKVSIILILISSLFSYPLAILPIHLNLIVFLTVISSLKTDNLFYITIHKIAFKAVAIVNLLFAVYLLRLEYNRYKSNLRWTRAAWYAKANKNFAFEEYEEIYPVLNYSDIFLYNYGAELSMKGDYAKSLKILKETKTKINNSDLYIHLGNTYEGLNMIDKAEESFKYANYIVPHKFYPRYRLVLLYKKTGRIDEAIALAREIVQQKPKVESPVVEQIKAEMENFVNNYH